MTIFKFHRRFFAQYLYLRRKNCEILGLTDNADKEQIKEAYYKLAKLYHPDLIEKKSLVSKYSFLEIKKAYEDLITEESDKNKINVSKTNEMDEILNSIIYTKHKFNEKFSDSNLNDKEKREIYKNNRPRNNNELFYPIYNIKLDLHDINLIKRKLKIEHLKRIKKLRIKELIMHRNGSINMNSTKTPSSSKIFKSNSQSEPENNTEINNRINNFEKISTFLIKFISISMISCLLLYKYKYIGLVASVYIIYSAYV